MRKVESVQRTKEEWTKRYEVEKYQPNLEIIGKYDESLAAKCENGIFVGKLEDDVRIWKGIPYSKQPVGEHRFERASDPEPSDKVFEAFYFGKTCLQPLDEHERASQYKQGEDCLNLNIWTSTQDENKKKPVLVFIHGGGWISGGTSDPLYDGFNFAHYNPEVLVVTITYRMGMMGQINLTGFSGGENFEFAMNNGILDQTQALKWIQKNIAAFGGDPENVTVSGESAGGGSVSALCILKDTKGLFKKAIPMSGSVNQANPIEFTSGIPMALKESFGCETVQDVQNIPFPELANWWRENCLALMHHLVRDGEVLAKDPFSCWERGDTKDLIVLQGHTSNEFAYYRSVLQNVDALFDGVCKAMVEHARKNGDEKFNAAIDEYEAALRELGYSEEEIPRQFANDYSLAFGNTYQAILHAKNGGKGFSYTFEKSYDGVFEYMGAGHAADCNYFFGNFDGQAAFGDEKEVELSRKFQEMIVNFCKTGNPSIEDFEWPEYNNETRQKMMIGENLRIEENPEEKRVDAELKMIEAGESFRYVTRLSAAMEAVAQKNPEALAEFMAKSKAMEEKIEQK